MKSNFIKLLVLGGALSPAAFALSLYDTAPPVGLPESYAIKYHASVRMGYDDNINASTTRKDSGMYYRLGVGAKYSDQESANRVSYSVSLGLRFYDKTADGTDQKTFSDSRVEASLAHSFSANSVYSVRLTMSLTDNPDFSNNISAPAVQGECFNWSFSNAYTQAIDSRWSWSATGSYAGNVYTKGRNKNDDRQYLTAGLTLSYRQSVRTTYSVSATYRYDFREKGDDSKNIYGNLAVSHAINAISTCHASVGVQFKMCGGENFATPAFRVGYNRKMLDGLTMSFYASLDNENVNTWSSSTTYRSNETWRVGAKFTYSISPKAKIDWGAALVSAEYSKARNGSKDYRRNTYSVDVRLRYEVARDLWLDVKYVHTDASRRSGDYERNKTSVGLTYNF